AGAGRPGRRGPGAPRSARPPRRRRRRARRRGARVGARGGHGAPRRRRGGGDGDAPRAELGRRGARAPRRDVGRDDGRDDAPLGRAARAAVRDDRPPSARGPEPGRAHRRARGRLPAGVDGVLRRRGARPVGAAPGRAPLAGDGEHEPRARRARARRRRRVPVDAAQGALPRGVPLADGLRRAGVARGRARRARHGRAPRRVLRRLLLGAHGAPLRGRRDEPALGRGARGVRPRREGGPGRRVAREGGRGAARRGRPLGGDGRPL
ncbi:MAG: Putative transmembrane protein, partial [uncultured Gemmatimonadaceae bacterium]